MARPARGDKSAGSGRLLKLLLHPLTELSDVRDEIAKQSDWNLWDVRDISMNVRNLPEDVARPLIETHFGSAWRAAFLGLAASVSFISAEEFFKPLTLKDPLPPVTQLCN